MSFLSSEEFKLKDGSNLLIRIGEERDAEQLLENGNLFISNGEGQVLMQGELDLSIEKEIEWINMHREKGTNILLVAEVNRKLVGHLGFYGASRKRLSHHGHFGIGLRPEFRGQGIGRKLLEQLIKWTKQSPIIEKIKLDVLSSNKRAIGLYESVGFKECGRGINEIKYEDGKYDDNISMELHVK